MKYVIYGGNYFEAKNNKQVVALVAAILDNKLNAEKGYEDIIVTDILPILPRKKPKSKCKKPKSKCNCGRPLGFTKFCEGYNEQTKTD